MKSNHFEIWFMSVWQSWYNAVTANSTLESGNNTWTPNLVVLTWSDWDSKLRKCTWQFCWWPFGDGENVTFHRLSDLQPGDEKVTAWITEYEYILYFWESQPSIDTVDCQTTPMSKLLTMSTKSKDKIWLCSTKPSHPKHLPVIKSCPNCSNGKEVADANDQHT